MEVHFVTPFKKLLHFALVSLAALDIQKLLFSDENSGPL